MSTRLRIFAALLIFGALAVVYLNWALVTLRALYEHYAHGNDSRGLCGIDWRYALNGCINFRPWLSWLELAVASLVLLAAAGVLVHWTQFPLRAMARSLAGFGPTNLTQRLDVGSGGEAARQLSAAINDMLARVADGYEAQRRFAASASHELRTPLATQRALIEVSLSQPLSADQQELLGRQLLTTNERNVMVIDGLLTLAEAQQGLATRDLVSLEEVAREAVAALTPQAQRRGVTITVALSAAPVIGERALLERMVANLVQNAIKYNVDGGRLHVEVSGPPPTLRVGNTGPPVPADQVAGLFEPFRRLSGDRLAGTDGVGLGLTIVRSIVQAHGGHTEAAANRDGGLTVTVRLPGRELAARG